MVQLKYFKTFSADHLHILVLNHLPGLHGPWTCRTEPDLHIHLPARHLPDDKVMKEKGPQGIKTLWKIVFSMI
jgi:hypothetical protein